MDFRSKLEEIEMTTEEVSRFSKALKDEKFREMLQDYAKEISDPENKKKYEEEITQLEQERGIDVQFIHPTAHHVLKTSINGKEKCFLNICSNDLINRPTCKPGRGQDGSVGQHWSLPYSLAPGRSDRDAKGKTCTIYDVVFHPDTLHISEKNSRFMELVNNTATQAVEEAFKVKLDKMNVTIPRMQYKGTPHPAVIRKPIPGDHGNEKALSYEERSPIHRPDTPPIANPQTPAAAPPQDSVTSRRKSSAAPLQHTQPHYTIKYRSVVELQDFRCSRNSVPNLRPKEIIISVDLPLIRSVGHIDLNITERSLVLESQTPAYKLELQLSYPVDDKKGEAKFNKTNKQLTVTLPVLAAKGTATGHVQGDQEERTEEEYEDKAGGKGMIHSNVENTAVSTVAPVAVFEYGTHARQCSSQQSNGKAVVELSEVSVVPSKGTVAVTFPEKTGVLSEEQMVNGSSEQISPALGHKSIKLSSLTEETEVQTEKEEVDSVYSSEQNQAQYLTTDTPAIRREKNQEDCSEVIMDHAISAALSLQNSLCFELD